MIPLVDAIAQVADCVGDEAFFVALESAMRLRKLRRADLDRLRGRLSAARSRLVDLARWDADSGLESLLRFRLRSRGLEIRSQVEVPGVGRVDVVIGDRLIVEVDGVVGHTGSARHKDLLRDAVAAAHGFLTLRFDYALVVHDWPLVEAAILRIVEAGAHLRPSR